MLSNTVLFSCICTVLLSTPTRAEPSMLEATLACQGDVMRLCAQDVPDRDAIIACMRVHRRELSPRCSAIFDEGTSPVEARRHAR